MRLQEDMQLRWGKALPLDYNLDAVRVWARKLQLSKPGTVIPDYLGHDQMYWEDQVPENFWEYLIVSLLNLLYATTAGIAANSPKAVANNASAIPGATIAKLVFLEIAID